MQSTTEATTALIAASGPVMEDVGLDLADHVESEAKTARMSAAEACELCHAKPGERLGSFD